ncbi:MAG: ACT domain-containing protein, partial [Alphaproteobacteria bacterium]
QLTETSIDSVEILFEGKAASLNTRALTQAALMGLLRPTLSEVNMVNAPIVAKERGIKISEIRRDQQGIYDAYIRLTLTTERQTRSVAGTVFSDGRPRLIQVKGINMDAEFAPRMLYVTNDDKPGFIGALGTLLGKAGVNIASFSHGRSGPNADAIALVEIDGEVDESVLGDIRKLSHVKQAKSLSF